MTLELLHARDAIGGRLSFSTSPLRFGDGYARARSDKNAHLIMIIVLARGATILALSLGTAPTGNSSENLLESEGGLWLLPVCVCSGHGRDSSTDRDDDDDDTRLPTRSSVRMCLTLVASSSRAKEKKQAIVNENTKRSGGKRAATIRRVDDSSTSRPIAAPIARETR